MVYVFITSRNFESSLIRYSWWYIHEEENSLSLSLRVVILSRIIVFAGVYHIIFYITFSREWETNKFIRSDRVCCVRARGRAKIRRGYCAPLSQLQSYTQSYS